MHNLQNKTVIRINWIIGREDYRKVLRRIKNNHQSYEVDQRANPSKICLLYNKEIRNRLKTFCKSKLARQSTLKYRPQVKNSLTKSRTWAILWTHRQQKTFDCPTIATIVKALMTRIMSKLIPLMMKLSLKIISNQT